jgi:hypothetical protein
METSGRFTARAAAGRIGIDGELCVAVAAG